MFSVFQRLYHETELEGVGVGLALCHITVQRHGTEVNATVVSDAGYTARVQ